MNFQQMKTTVLTLVLVLVGTLVWANDSKMSNVELQASYGRKLGIDISDMHSAATIRLESKGGLELISMVAEGPSFAKLLDLSNLNSGSYELIIEYGVREMNQEISINTDEKYIVLGSRDVFMTPIIRKFQEDFVDLTMLNDRIGTVHVEIVNSNGRTVYSEDIKNVLKVEKRYDLGRLSRDTYSFVVTTPKRTYAQYVQNW